jgi:endoglucanase
MVGGRRSSAIHGSVWLRSLEIPLTLEPMPWDSESDADVLQIAGAGVPTGCIFIPVRYMHSPVEMVDVEDVRLTGAVVAEFVRGLGETAGRFLEQG